jgi:hypothetical protein
LDKPFNTKDEAPRNSPAVLQATVAIAAIEEFLDTAASTLTFATPDGGGIHLGAMGPLSLVLDGAGASTSRSTINRRIKQCVDNGLWNKPSWIIFLLACHNAHIVTTT